MRRMIALALAVGLSVTAASPAAAGRCATGLRGDNLSRFPPLRPLPRGVAAREVAPVPTRTAHVFTTEHFRVLWGDAYDPLDPEWADPDGDGVPIWVDALAAALEEAYATEVDELGFPAPYGVEDYYLDAYVGNTGVRVYDARTGWYEVTIGSGYYAYTQVDTDFGVAYFVFAPDFSSHASDELGVLRATAAHELFHAVQRADYPWDDEDAIPADRWEREGWWTEATATWMEEVCQPGVNDYVNYVPGFLSRPDLALSSTDGLREYGAAIFPGLLWLRYGGAALWQDIFRDAYDLGLEASMEEALAAAAEPPLADVVASFWSLAAHPEDAWPDGARFGSAALAAASDLLPIEIASTTAAPGRFGARLVRVDGAVGALYGALPEAPEGTRWTLAASAPGGDEAAVLEPVAGANPADLWLGDGSPVYVALVNDSDGEGPFYPYVARISADDGTPVDPPVDDGGVVSDPSVDDGGVVTDPPADGGTSVDPPVDGGNVGTDPPVDGGGVATDPPADGGTSIDPPVDGGGAGTDPVVDGGAPAPSGSGAGGGGCFLTALGGG